MARRRRLDDEDLIVVRREPGMNNDEIESVRSAATPIAAAIINSFVVTHSIIITVIVAVSVLAGAFPG